MDMGPQETFSEVPSSPGYGDGLLEALNIANRTPPINGFQESFLPEHVAPQWTRSPAYGSYRQGIRYDYTRLSAGEGHFNGAQVAHSYGTNSSAPLNVTPTRYVVNMAHLAQINSHSSIGFTGPQTSPFDYEWMLGYNQNKYEYVCRRSDFSGEISDDEKDQHRGQDTQWLRRFLKRRDETARTPKIPRQAELSSVSGVQPALYKAPQLVSVLEEWCYFLKLNLHNHGVWTKSYLKALHVQKVLRHKAEPLDDIACYRQLKADVCRVAQRRARRRKAIEELRLKEKHADNRRSEKEAAVDKWRSKEMQEVEQKKKEQTMKLAADSVLCEVRKKQVDVKRIQDVLKSLEKLRRLRKEAASRKGIITDQCDTVFRDRLEQIRSTMKRRMAIYMAEKKALMVMLEGEQEEERNREQERQVMKERGRLLQMKRRVKSLLFGGDLKAEGVLQPFRDYYSQADQSMHTLIQIRNEWDKFMVAPDHLDGSFVPQRWVLPQFPSNNSWASVLQMADTDDL